MTEHTSEPHLPDREEIAANLVELMNYALDAVWIINEDDVVEYMNKAAEELCGYSADELIGQPLAKVLPPEVAPHHVNYIRAYIARGGESPVLGRVREVNVIDRDGKTIPVEIKAFELSSRGGKRRFGAVMRDNTEHKQNQAQQQELLERMERLATEDELTGLANRREFFHAFDRLIASVKRRKRPACVGIIDIDHFKQINDQHGHDAGDKALREVAALIACSVRGEDMVGRIGGEEFAVLLPDTEPDAARISLDRVRVRVRENTIHLPDEQDISLTVSIGISAIDPTGTGHQSLKQADTAMLEAKERGRDRTCVFGGEDPVHHLAAASD